MQHLHVTAFPWVGSCPICPQVSDGQSHGRQQSTESVRRSVWVIWTDFLIRMWLAAGKEEGIQIPSWQVEQSTWNSARSSRRTAVR